MIDHLDESDINDLLDSRLGRDRENDSRLHLSECADCMNSTNRIAAIITAAIEARVAVQPDRNLWPAISRATIYSGGRRDARNPWIYTIVLTCLVSSSITLWLVVSPPWARQAARKTPVQIEARPDIGEARRSLIALLKERSDATKVRELGRVVPIVGADSAERLWTNFFAVVSTIESAADRRKVLLDVVPFSVGKPAVTGLIIDSVEPMLSSSNKRDVLVALARSGSVVTDALRERYLNVALSISSENDRARAQDALNRD
ncbi:MAG: hypothetical protein ABJC63_12130 [Gemmatimonadales bacterium]